MYHLTTVRITSVQSLSCVQLFATPWTAARQASLFITNSWNLLKLMSIELVMPSNHLLLCHPLLLPPSIFPSFRVFSSRSVLHIRWPKYWSFSISHSNEYSGLEWPSPTSLQIINAGEGVQKREPSRALEGMSIGEATMENNTTSNPISGAYIQTKLQLKQIHAPLYSQQHQSL